jgi:hypothetical protein
MVAPVESTALYKIGPSARYPAIRLVDSPRPIAWRSSGRQRWFSSGAYRCTHLQRSCEENRTTFGNSGIERLASVLVQQSDQDITPTQNAVESSGVARVRHVNRQQMCWHVVDVERLIEDDHPARAIWDLVGRLDLAGFLAPIGSVQGTVRSSCI